MAVDSERRTGSRWSGCRPCRREHRRASRATRRSRGRRSCRPGASGTWRGSLRPGRLDGSEPAQPAYAEARISRPVTARRAGVGAPARRCRRTTARCRHGCSNSSLARNPARRGGVAVEIEPVGWVARPPGPGSVPGDDGELVREPFELMAATSSARRRHNRADSDESAARCQHVRSRSGVPSTLDRLHAEAPALEQRLRRRARAGRQAQALHVRDRDALDPEAPDAPDRVRVRDAHVDRDLRPQAALEELQQRRLALIALTAVRPAPERAGLASCSVTSTSAPSRRVEHTRRVPRRTRERDSVQLATDRRRSGGPGASPPAQSSSIALPGISSPRDRP